MQKLSHLEDVEILTFDKDGVPVTIKDSLGIRYL